MKPSLLLIAFSALSVLLWAPAVVAVDPSLDLSQYAHTAWTVRDGSLASGVRSITQTPDGYLWLGTEFGLVRFDGVRFVRWNAPGGERLPSTNIRSLLASRGGTLWIGTLEGLASWKDGKLIEYAELAQKNVTALLEDREGTVWAATFSIPAGRLCAIRSGGVQCYGADGSLGEWVWSVYEDDEGRLWVGAETGLWRWKPGPPTRYPMPHPIETTQSITGGAQHSGPLAIGEGIWQLVGGKMKEYPVATPPGRLTTPVNMLREPNGDLWVGTLQDGLLQVSQGKTSLFAQAEGLSSDRVLSLYEDRESNLWVGTADGLDRFHKLSVFSISNKQGLSSRSVWSVLVARDQSVWLSTLDGLNRWKDGHITVYRSVADERARRRSIPPPAGNGGRTTFGQVVTERTDPGIPDNRVGSLCEDDQGRIWVSTPRGIARFDGTRFTHVKEVPPGWVNAIAGDHTGGVWISYQDQGLVHWSGGKVVERVPWSRLGGDVIASSVVSEPGGGLWLGFFQGGLTYFKGGQVRAHYTNGDGLGSGRVMGLHLDSDGTIWASTEGGLSQLKHGRIATLSTANGLPCNTVHWTMEVAGSFWLYTGCGLLRIPTTEMEKWSADPKVTIQFQVFDSSDGVRSHALLTGYTPRVSKSADGRIWFAHFESVSVVDPQEMRLKGFAPPVHVEEITADGKSYSPTAGLRLRPRVRDVVIHYTALSLTAPEKVHFKYKLDGQDQDWKEVINDRQAHYSNLAPRKYRFHVIACNNSGLWNEEGAMLDFVIPPMWYQTNWFYALCAATFLALLWAAYLMRVRQLAYQFNMRLEERVSERTRIARDLHDTLLQSFQALLLRFQAGINLLSVRPDDGRKLLEDAVEHASQAISEGRDAISGLRMSTIETNDLTDAIETVAEELAAAQGDKASTPFQVLVEGTPRELRPILRDEIYRFATEALRNAFQHAAAQKIEVEIRYDEKYFRLRVRDDGKGIPPDVLGGDGRQGHYGLHGMRERARLVGGKLTIWTQLNSGTEIELLIPGARAYVNPARPFWHFGKRSATEAHDKENIKGE